MGAIGIINPDNNWESVGVITAQPGMKREGFEKAFSDQNPFCWYQIKVQVLHED